MATGKNDKSALAELLVEMGLVDRDQMSLAVAQQRMSGTRLARILAERRLVDEDRLAKAISAKLGLESVNLSSLKIHERVLAIIPANIALRYGALPIAIKRTNQAEFVYVVMADPLDGEALAELQRVSGRQIRVLVGTATELDRALEHYYRSSLSSPGMQPVTAGSSPSIQKPPSSPPAGNSIPGLPKTNTEKRPGLPAISPSGQTAMPPSQTSSQTGSHPQAQRKSPAPLGGNTPPPMPIASGGRPGKAAPPVPPPAQAQPPPPFAQQLATSASRPMQQPQQAPRPAAAPAPPPLGGSLPQRSLARDLPRREGPSPFDQKSPLEVRSSAVLDSERLPVGTRAGVDRLAAPLAPVSDIGAGLVKAGTPGMGTALPPLPRAPLPGMPPVATPAAKSTPSAGTALPRANNREALRDTLYDTPPSFLGAPKTESPPVAGAPRVPSAEEDQTNFDPAVPFAIQAIEEIAVERGLPKSATIPQPGSIGGEWDLAVRDWERPPSSPWPDSGGLPEANALGSPAAAQSIETQDKNEPVTTEASLEQLQRDVAATASQTPTTRPISSAEGEDVQIEIMETSDGPDDMKTSQVEVTLDSAQQILSVVPVVPSQASPAPPKARANPFASTLELPIEIDEGPSPFEGPESAEIPVGLERTGIIPAIDWEREEFVPPPLAKSTSSPALAGIVDIPFSAAAVRARREADELEESTIDPPREAAPAAEARAETVLADQVLEEVDEAPKKRKSDPPRIATEENEPLALKIEAPVPQSSDLVLEEIEPEIVKEITAPEQPTKALVEEEPKEAAADQDGGDDSGTMPVIEPSSLQSLIDGDGGAQQEITGHDESTPFRSRKVEAEVSDLPQQGPEETPLNLVAMRSEPTRLFDEQNREEKPATPRARGDSGPEEDPTNPRIDKSKVSAALDPEKTPPRDEEVDRDRVLAELGGMLVVGPSRDQQRETMEIPRNQQPRPEEEDARRMVTALVAGDSLTSADRAQLVLALGRLLVSKGILSREELIDELKK